MREIEKMIRRIDEIKVNAENLKCEIWSVMDDLKIEHKGLKESVNEMLDLLDELEGAE